MGSKFTADDLFRIAEDNLSALQAEEFRFSCISASFRQSTSKGFLDVVAPGVELSKDEVNLFEKLFQGLKTSRGRGAR